MFDFTTMSAGLATIFHSYTPWIVMLPGMVIGVLGGAIPGIQISTAMAIFLPVTMYMNFEDAILFLTAIFTGASFGGGITAVLMNIPGTTSAIATTFDGYPMARQGKHNEALGLALGSSCIGCAFGYVILLALIGPISVLVVKLGPAEMFVIVLWGISLLAGVAGKNRLKGIVSGFFGLLLGTVGINESGYLRGNMGLTILMDGIPPVPAMIGLFAIAGLFNLLTTSYLVEDVSKRKGSLSKITQGFLTTFRHPRVLLRGGIIGVLVGAAPGIGSSVSNLLSYMETKRHDPDPASFGQGNPKGVIASESANSSSEAGSMATLLALGIPGGGATAIMLAAFSMHNITGGPIFVRENLDIVYGIIFGNLFQVIILIGVGLCLLPLVASLVRVSMTYLVPSILVVAVFGSYGLTGHIVGPITTFVFAVVGWIARRNGYSVAGIVIGILLGNMTEGALINLYQISGGQIFTYVMSRPVCIILFVLLLVILFADPICKMIKQRFSKKCTVITNEE